jgi:NAD(P)-dependent dehydrogenase (short-subunit alcohol dehydrogenase family)
MTFDLELGGRRALVTAGTKGIGAAIVAVLSENGARVFTTARSIPRDSRADVQYIAADITPPPAVPWSSKARLTVSAASTSSSTSSADHLG